MTEIPETLPTNDPDNIVGAHDLHVDEMNTPANPNGNPGNSDLATETVEDVVGLLEDAAGVALELCRQLETAASALGNNEFQKAHIALGAAAGYLELLHDGADNLPLNL